jgi:hypothetical protein
MAGVTIDVCFGFAAMQAVDAGYNVYGVVDASGAFEVAIRENAVARMQDHARSWDHAHQLDYGCGRAAAKLDSADGAGLGRVFHDHYHSYGLLMDSFESVTRKWSIKHPNCFAHFFRRSTVLG